LTVKYPGSAPKALGLPASASTSGKSSLDAEAQVMWRATGNLKHDEEEEKEEETHRLSMQFLCCMQDRISKNTSFYTTAI
jgi:hypothetical protein